MATQSDTFTLISVHGGARLHLQGPIARGLENYDGTSFIATLVGDVSAAVEVYDVQPHRWSGFFADLAEHWKGWPGAKTHESLERHLRVSCKMDHLGHVELRVQLRGDMLGSDWRAENTIHLEAGQLEDIARAAAEYFG